MIGGIRHQLTQAPMNQFSDVERLSDQQDVILIVRALVDRQNQLLSGEVGGPEEDGCPERWVRFCQPSALLDAVQRWLAGRR